ncbi:MAG: hypothetical protein R3Y44_03520 [Rikenellaceae bacterium]
MKIHYESDFKLHEEHLSEDVTTPFRFKYRTSGFSQIYTVEFDGRSYSNCRRLEDGSLLIIFEGHELGFGPLQVRREYFLTDADFADNTYNKITVDHLDITLVDGRSDDVSTTVEVYPAYQRGDDGYTPVKGVDYYTDEELEELLAQLDARVADKLGSSDIVQTAGDSADKVMSQAAATNAFMAKNDIEFETLFAYGVQFDTSLSTTTCTRIGNLALHRSLPVQSKMRGCLLSDDGEVVEYLPEGSWIGSTLDGSVGQVMVELPAHYRKFVTNGTVREVWISEYPISGYDLVAKSYISAYEASLQRSTLKLASVANDSSDYRGGNNNNGWDHTYCNLLKRPVTSINRANMRTYARNRKSGSAEWNCAVYEQYKSVYWLFTVEYATLNCQQAVNAELTSEGYRQGALGDGMTTVDSGDWITLFDNFPFIECGYTDQLGNGSGELPYSIEYDIYGVYISANVNRYRGIENPFGHIGKCLDGVNILTDPNSTICQIYVATDPELFSDDGCDGYELRGYAPTTSGFIGEILFGDAGDIIPSAVGGGASTYHSDFYVVNVSGSVIYAPFSGGVSDATSMAGLSASTLMNAVSSATIFGTRLSFIPNTSN